MRKEGVVLQHFVYAGDGMDDEGQNKKTYLAFIFHF